MKASELRIGNLVWDFNVIHPTEKYVTVETIELEGCMLRNERGVYKIKYHFMKPIPLTEEWLLKLGFEHFNDTGWSISHKKIYFILSYSFFKNIVTIETDEEAWAHIYNIKYVHQLQNLYFALTGEELILNT
jgi:hypothetical protein